MNANTIPPADSVLEEAIAMFHQMSVPERSADDELIARLTEERNTVWPFGWSVPPRGKYLTHPIIRFAMAALVLLTFLAWLTLNTPTSVAIAEVIQSAEKHRFFRYKLRQITDDENTRRRDITVTPLDSTVIADLKSPRFRMETRVVTLNGTVEHVSVFIQDAKKDRLLHFLTEMEIMTGIVKRKEALLDNMPQDDVKPFSDIKPNRPFLDHLREFQKNTATTSAKDTLDGRETVRYQLVEKKRTAILWVDAKTMLPVRIEYEMIEPVPWISLNKWVYTDFEWDPEVKDVEQFFSTEPPAGYALKDKTRKGT